METFINRWLWLMSLNEIRRLKDSILKQQSAANAQPTPKPTAVTSPNELPPPSPASSIGSSAGSNNNNNNTNTSNQQNGSHTGSQSQPDANQQQQQQQQADSAQKLVVLYERYFKLNEYNIRSQNFWDSNEHQISEVDYLNGSCLIIFFIFFYLL